MARSETEPRAQRTKISCEAIRWLRRHSPRRSSTSFAGGYSGRATPDPIPNSVVKTSSADGTAGETLWESRTPPALCPLRKKGAFLFGRSSAAALGRLAAPRRPLRLPRASIGGAGPGHATRSILDASEQKMAVWRPPSSASLLRPLLTWRSARTSRRLPRSRGSPAGRWRRRPQLPRGRVCRRT